MTEPTTKRRRWFRYSMRTMLVVVTLLCVLLALVIGPAQRQRRTVAKIHALNPLSNVLYDYGPKPRGPEWLRRWIGDDYFQHVVAVSLVFDGREDVTLDDLANLPGLERLSIEGMPMPNHSLGTLGRLRKLKRLLIDSDEITDRGLEQLSSVAALERLTVKSHQITGAGLRPLAVLQNLRMLVLRSDRISAGGLESVAQLANLDILNIYSDTLTDECLEALKGMKGLTVLRITGSNGFVSAPPGVTDEGLKYIAQLSNLQRLTISSPGITDRGLAHLAALRKLDSLNVRHRRPKYTEEGVARLHAQLPALTVEYNAWKLERGRSVSRPLMAAPKYPQRSK